MSSFELRQGTPTWTEGDFLVEVPEPGVLGIYVRDEGGQVIFQHPGSGRFDTYALADVDGDGNPPELAALIAVARAYGTQER